MVDIEHIMYFIFLSLCLFILPGWTWYKRKRYILSLVLALIGVFVAYVIVGHFKYPVKPVDHDPVLFGLLLYLPPVTFLFQLLIYGAVKLVGHIINSGKYR